MVEKLLKDQEEKYSYSYSTGNQIELRHVKVESGFVYILSNELMPNIYKVGFTERNPDERANEIRLHLPPADGVDFIFHALRPRVRTTRG